MTPLDITFWTGWTLIIAAITAVTTSGADPLLIPATMLAWLVALAVARIREHQP
ncbi:hypothetical protein ABZ897_16200 [Nonomuraea sp. NPDC046802]|uniref:hypothetical protein n=1 Tax=Nonomuraea sp. NPDC046802 TaxID=3154919 RepID=UPI0034029202